MRKRISTLLIAVMILILTFTACTKDTGNSTDPTTAETTATNTQEVSSVFAEFADSTSADLTNAQKLTADNSESETEIVFRTVGEVTNFTFCSVGNIDYTDDGTYTAELVPMHTVGTLNESNPLVVTMTFWGDIPSYGITYTDSEGTLHSELITLSGENGSVVLVAQ